MVGFASRLDLSPNRLALERERLEADGAALIDFSRGNPTEQGILFPAEVLVEAYRDYFSDRKYAPDPQGAYVAREAIAKFYVEKQCPELGDPDRIFITASTSESYALLLSLLCDPGDNILVPSPSYPLFDLLAENARVQLRHYKLIEQDSHWSIDIDSIVTNADEKTRAILMVSPHNPTGLIIEDSATQISSLNLPLISDEVFGEFSLKPEVTVTSTCRYYPHLPVFTLNGISKMCALPDLKLGWMGLNACALQKYRKRLTLLNDLFLSANGPTQCALPRIMHTRKQVTTRLVEYARDNLSLISAVLKNFPELRLLPTQAGLSVAIELPRNVDEEELCLKLLCNNFVVHPGYFYDMPQQSCLVISLISDRSAIQSLMDSVGSMCSAN